MVPVIKFLNNYYRGVFHSKNKHTQTIITNKILLHLNALTVFSFFLVIDSIPRERKVNHS